jgi:hypothetical protein
MNRLTYLPTTFAAGVLTVGIFTAGATEGQTPPAQRSLGALVEATEISVYPPTLSDFSDEFGRQPVRLPVSRVVEVVGTRALVVEPIGKWSKTVPWLDRVLVVIANGTLSAEPEAIDDTQIRVHGMVRTPLGMQVSREAQWPQELTRQRIDKLEVQALVMATSVETLDGVELTNQRFGAQAQRR